MQADRVGILVSVLAATIAFQAGWFLTPAPLSNIVVGTIGAVIIAGCIVGLVAMRVRAHRQRRYSPDLADQWEENQRARRKAAQLKAFWRSPASRGIHDNPLLEDDSVRIEPIKGGKRPDAFLGRYAVPISGTEVAYAQIARSSSRNHRLARWLSKRASCRLFPAWLYSRLEERLLAVEDPPPSDPAAGAAENLPEEESDRTDDSVDTPPSVTS